MLVLMENEKCHLAFRCEYEDGCWGARTNRPNKFTCEFVDNQGNIKENCFRNPDDKTGKMQIIID